MYVYILLFIILIVIILLFVFLTNDNKIIKGGLDDFNLIFDTLNILRDCAKANGMDKLTSLNNKQRDELFDAMIKTVKKTFDEPYYSYIFVIKPTRYCSINKQFLQNMAKEHNVTFVFAEQQKNIENKTHASKSIDDFLSILLSSIYGRNATVVSNDKYRDLKDMLTDIKPFNMITYYPNGLIKKQRIDPKQIIINKYNLMRFNNIRYVYI
jgi:hypothetical protein